MDLLDSHNVNNRVKKRTVATAVLVHLYLTVITLGFWLIPLSLFSLITAALLRPFPRAFHPAAQSSTQSAHKSSRTRNSPRSNTSKYRNKSHTPSSLQAGG